MTVQMNTDEKGVQSKAIGEKIKYWWGKEIVNAEHQQTPNRQRRIGGAINGKTKASKRMNEERNE